MSKEKAIRVIAVIVVIIAVVYIYRMVSVSDPPQSAVTDTALEQAKQENADMKRRIDALEKQVKQGAKEIRGQERKAVDSLPPDAVAGAIADELRLFLGSD